MTPVFATCFEEMTVQNGMTSYLCSLIVTILASRPQYDEDRQQISMLFQTVSSSNVNGVQALVVLGGCRAAWHNLCAPLKVKYKPKGLVSLCVAMVKILRVSGDMGVWVDWERLTVILKITHLLFPFKVDQFKSDIKIRKKNQVKKNTAKGYSIYIQWFS